MDILTDYHQIWMIFSIFLFVLCVLLLFLDTGKNVLKGNIVAVIVIASFNNLLCYMVMYGFFRIGLIGIDLSTGYPLVYGYEEMWQFFGVFLGLSLINIGIIYFAFLLYMFHGVTQK